MNLLCVIILTVMSAKVDSTDTLQFIPVTQTIYKPIIVYFFLGHSGMAGVCAEMDTVPHERVLSYNDINGFYNCTDKTIGGKFGNHGSPVMPFLKRMALLYPDYNFCGIKYSHVAGYISDIAESNYRNFFLKRMNDLKGKVIIGGMILYYGFCDGGEKSRVDNLSTSFSNAIDWLRQVTDNSTLPIILIRYEINSDTTKLKQYHRWTNELIDNLESVPMNKPSVSFAPIRCLPKGCFCDDHHPNKDGYDLIGQDAAAMIQLMQYDFWN